MHNIRFGLLLDFQEATSLMPILNQRFCVLAAFTPASFSVSGREVVDRIDWTRLINRQETAVAGVANSACVHVCTVCQQLDGAPVCDTAPSRRRWTNCRLFLLQSGLRWRFARQVSTLPGHVTAAGDVKLRLLLGLTTPVVTDR